MKIKFVLVIPERILRIFLRNKKIILIGSFFILGMFFGYISLFYIKNNRVDLVIDATISKGQYFDIFINKNWGNPKNLSIIPGVRSLYVFKDVPWIISDLRIDPSDLIGAKIIIYNIKFQKNGSIFKMLDGNNLRLWNISNVKFLDIVQENAAEMISLSDDPIIQKENVIGVESKIKWLPRIFMSTGGLIVFLFFVLFIVVYSFIFFSKKDRFNIFYFIGTLFCSFLIATVLFKISLLIPGNIPEVHNTVGFGSFSGLIKGLYNRAFLIAIVGSGVFVLLSFYLWNIFVKKYDLNLIEYQNVISLRKFSPYFFYGMVCLFGLVTFPYLHDVFQYNTATTSIVNLDNKNIIIWNFFRYLGLVPFKDFWYPYSGLYYMSLRIPPDIIFLWIHRIILFSVSFFSCYNLLKYDKKKSIIILSCMLLLEIFLFSASERYFLSLSTVLLLAASISVKRLEMFIFLGVYSFYVFFVEPMQLLYAFIPCLFLIGVAIAAERKTEDRLRILYYFAIVFGVAFFLIIAYLIRLSFRGALSQYINFYTTMESSALYIMSPMLSFNYEYSFDNIFWVVIILFFSSSLFVLLQKSKKILEFNDFVILAIVLLSIIVSQKWIVRFPSVAQQIISIPIFGLLLLFVQFRYIPERFIARYSFAFFFGFFFIFPLILNESAVSVIYSYVTRPLTLYEDIPLLFTKKSAWDSIKRSYFLPERFLIDDVRGDEFKEIFLKKFIFDKGDDLFVLGDDSYLYMVLDQKNPPYISFYNQSILYSQRNTSNWIDVHKPKYVLWRDTFKDFDGVPNYTRVPLVFEKVIQDYKFKDTYESFLILERKSKEERIDLDFWKKHLSDTIQLGFIPSRSEPERSLSKNTSTSFMATYLIVDIEKPSDGREREIVFNIHNDSYKIKFRERRGITTYHILLDRIWFWNVAKKNEIEAHLVANDGEGMKVKTSNLNLSKEILY